MKQGQTRNLKTATIALVAMVAVIAVLVGPTAVLAQSDVRADRALRYSPRLGAGADIVKFRDDAREIRAFMAASPRKATPIPEPEPQRVASSGHSLTRTSTSSGSSGSSGSTSSGGTTTSTGSSGGASELATAQSILAGYIAKYPILSGASVTIGTTPGGHQAVAYYTVGKIVISPTHTASLERIIGHEIWHIIDYRDNGRIDWGESVPPSNYP
jgi:hypothetical protein